METSSETGDPLVEEAIPFRAFLPDRYRFPDGESLEGEPFSGRRFSFPEGQLSRSRFSRKGIPTGVTSEGIEIADGSLILREQSPRSTSRMRKKSRLKPLPMERKSSRDVIPKGSNPRTDEPPGDGISLPARRSGRLIPLTEIFGKGGRSGRRLLAKKQFFAERRRETERKFHYSPSFFMPMFPADSVCRDFF